MTDIAANYIDALDRIAKSDPLGVFVEKMGTYSNDVARGFAWHAEQAMLAGAKQTWALKFLAQPAPNGQTDLAALRIFERRLVDAVMSAARFPSSSSSPMSNLAERSVAEAAATMLEELRYVLEAAATVDA